MQLNGQVKLSEKISSLIGSTVPQKPEQIRTAVLNAIGAGFNTMRQIMENTHLDNATITNEIEVMKNLYIVVHPGPPVETYWVKGKEPKGKVYVENGKAVAVKDSNSKDSKKSKLTAEIISRNAQIKDTAQLAVPDAISAEITGEEYREEMPLNLLEEHSENPRGTVDVEEPSFNDLVDSIKASGVQQPLIITPKPGTNRFRIIIGHRRFRASIFAGKQFAPCIIRRFDSAASEENIMLIENIQRQNLSPVQEAKAFKKAYARENKDIHAVARALGLTQSYIANRIKLLNLEIGIQIMLDRGELSLEAGMILSSLSPDKQLKLLPRAQRMKSKDLREVAFKMKNATTLKIPNTRKQQIKERRVTTDEEKFTRSGALRSLDGLGDAAWISVSRLKEAFDDVCIDSCLESKDESLCNGCPVPRLVEAIVRRKLRSEQ